MIKIIRSTAPFKIKKHVVVHFLFTESAIKLLTSVKIFKRYITVRGDSLIYNSLEYQSSIKSKAF